jgi:cobalt/nickel transport system ATP-binding protein
MAELTPAIVAACGLTYDYPGGIRALGGLSVAVPRGGRLAVLGANGCGKTTLLLHLNGTLKPISGRVELDGAVPGYDRRSLLGWRGRVGLVLQDPDDQLFAATVAEDVSFGPLNLGLPATEVRQRVDEALAALGIAALAGRPTHQLSHGQKRRAALAGVLAMRPEVILLDEPTAGLDPAGADQLMACLERLHQAGTTLVISTHDLDLACAWADQVAVLGGGRCVRQGPALEVLAEGGLLEAAGLKRPLVLEIATALGIRARSRQELLAQLGTQG